MALYGGDRLDVTAVTFVSMAFGIGHRGLRHDLTVDVSGGASGAVLSYELSASLASVLSGSVLADTYTSTSDGLGDVTWVYWPSTSAAEVLNGNESRVDMITLRGVWHIYFPTSALRKVFGWALINSIVIDAIIDAGAYAYWRWDAGVTNSSGVTSWIDRVASYDLTATSTAKPTLGASSINFNGTTNNLYSGSLALPGLIDADDGFTYFARMKWTTTNGSSRLLVMMGTAVDSWNKNSFHLKPNGSGAGLQRVLVYDNASSIIRDVAAIDALSDATLHTMDGRLRGPANSDSLMALDGVDDSGGADTYSGGTMPTLSTFCLGAMRTGIYAANWLGAFEIKALVIGPPGMDRGVVRTELAAEFA